MMPMEIQSHGLWVESMRIYFLGLVVTASLRSCPSIFAKNSVGFTRCAASCGHAYTQLGSSRSWHKSHDVALRILPWSLASFPSRSNSWIVMLPYGQLFAHRPQPTHQSSIITSSELRRRIDPTGHPIMHSGSRHCRQDVATRYLSKRTPSRNK